MFPYTLSDKGATVMIDGRPRMFSTVHPSYAAIVEAIENDDGPEVRKLVDVKATIFNLTLGRVEILDNTIMVAGKEVSGRLVDRILEMVSRGSKAVDGYIKFLDNMMLNPSKRATDELYGFIEACDLPITPEGMFLAYKKVKSDYTDIHSGKFDNSIGATPTMARNEVDEDKDRTCSSGLHFCSYTYLPKFGGFSGSRVMVVEINPKDVVAIPSDYDNAKGRTCKYKVIDEIEDWELNTLTPWFTDEYSESDDSESDDSELKAGDQFDETQFDIYTDLLEEQASEIHGDAEITDIPAPNGIIAKVSDNGVSIVVTDGVDQDVVSEFMSDITGHVLRATGEEDDTPAPIDTSTTDTPEVTPDNAKRQKLSPNDVREIRSELAAGDVSYAVIGKRFGVHRRTIEKIDKGDIWSSVT